jgi:hypothetical protein
VIGYTPDAEGKVSEVKIGDPATGQTETMSREEFEGRWGDLHMKGVDTGLNHVMLVHLPGENTPIRARDGKTIMSNDIPLPEGGMGLSGAVADFVADTVNELNPVQVAKNAWHSIFG